MARRGHHEGSIRKRPDGRWEARVSTGQTRVSLYGKTRAEVARKLAVALGELGTGGGLSRPSCLSLAEFLDEWLENSAGMRVKPQTLGHYRRMVTNHISPRIGKVRLDEFDTRQVQAMLAAVHSDGNAAGTVNAVRAVRRNALGQAVAWGMLGSNPVSGTTKVRVSRRVDSPWTADQARAFLSSLEGDPLEALFYLALSLGLRQGELIALRWSDVDLDRATITVARTAVLIDHQVVFDNPKTRTSIRTLRLPARAVQLLRRHAESKDGSTDLIFHSRHGTPLRGKNLWQSFKSRVAAAGLPPIRFHDLRHVCATLLLGERVDIKVVSQILGHSSVATTADLYAHVLPSLQDDAARRIDGVLDTGPRDEKPEQPGVKTGVMPG